MSSRAEQGALLRKPLRVFSVVSMIPRAFCGLLSERHARCCSGACLQHQDSVLQFLSETLEEVDLLIKHCGRDL